MCRGRWIFLAFSDVGVVWFWPQIAVHIEQVEEGNISAKAGRECRRPLAAARRGTAEESEGVGAVWE
jgi:hypothetical protein